MTEATVLITTGVGADQTFLDGANAAKNYGASILYNIFTTQRNAILRFDLSGIPAGAKCTSAVLKLYHYNNVGINNTYCIYKISDANGNWVEGNNTGTTADAGEPCWNAKEANGSGGVTTAWAGSAGLSSAGTDYINTALATASTGASITTNAALDFTFNADGLSVLENWFGDATNNGFIIWATSGTNVGSFHSKESTTSGYRPVLVVNYEVTDALIAVDFALSVATFDAPVLVDATITDSLTATDLILSEATFDAPTLSDFFLVTPPCRTFTINADDRTHTINRENRTFTVGC